MQGYEVINRSTIFLMTVFRGKWKEDLRLQNLYSIWQFNKYKLHWFSLGYDSPILNRQFFQKMYFRNIILHILLLAYCSNVYVVYLEAISDLLFLAAHLSHQRLINHYELLFVVRFNRFIVRTQNNLLRFLLLFNVVLGLRSHGNLFCYYNNGHGR